MKLLKHMNKIYQTYNNKSYSIKIKLEILKINRPNYQSRYNNYKMIKFNNREYIQINYFK